MNWPYGKPKTDPVVSAEERVRAAAKEDQTTIEAPPVAAVAAVPTVEDHSIADQVAEAIAQALKGGEARPAGLIQGMPLTQVGLHQHADLEIERKEGFGHVVDPATFRQDF